MKLPSCADIRMRMGFVESADADERSKYDWTLKAVNIAEKRPA